MDNKLVVISIAAVIGIIVLGSVLMPILDDTTAKTDTYENTGYYYMQTVGDDGLIYTINNGAWTLNSESLTLPTDEISAADLTVIATDDFVIRGNGAIRGSDGTSNLYFNLTTGTITVDSDSVSIVGQDNVSNEINKDISYSTFFGLSDSDSPYLMSKPGGVYLKGDSEILGCGVTNGAYGVAFIFITGSIDDGVEVNYTQTLTNAAITSIDNVQVNKTEVADHDDLYFMESITFDIKATGVADTHATYNRIIVPSSVTADRTDPMPDNQVGLLSAIPILIILAILVGIVALIFRSRMD